MKKLGNVTLLIFLLSNIFIFTNTIYSSENSNNSDGYIILNLHWSAEEKITVNSVKKFAGLVKRAGRKVKKQPFLYTLHSGDGKTIRIDYFKIPRKLHYDYIDEFTGKLTGGQLQPEELDFVIRVPYFHKAKQIMFYKTNMNSHSHKINANMRSEESDDYELLGAVNF